MLWDVGPRCEACSGQRAPGGLRGDMHGSRDEGKVAKKKRGMGKDGDEDEGEEKRDGTKLR